MTKLECISNEQRMFTLKNPNLIPWAKGYSNPNPSGLRPSRIWNGMGPWPSGYQFGFFEVNILCSLDIHSNLVKGEFLLLKMEIFFSVQINIKILSNCKVQFSFSRVFGLINPNTLELQSVWIFQSKYPRERNCSLTEKDWKIQHTHFISKILLT